MARRGEVDVVLMHARPQEEKFVADGFATKRFDVMYNDFVLIGPKSDPAGVKGKDIATALKAIEAKGAPFVTRGDRSGTHARGARTLDRRRHRHRQRQGRLVSRESGRA